MWDSQKGAAKRKKRKKEKPYPIDSNNKSALCSKDKPMGKLPYFPQKLCHAYGVSIYLWKIWMGNRKPKRRWAPAAITATTNTHIFTQICVYPRALLAHCHCCGKKCFSFLHTLSSLFTALFYLCVCACLCGLDILFWLSKLGWRVQ